MNNFLIEENQTNSKKNITKINLSIEKDNNKENSKKSPNINIINGMETKISNTSIKPNLFNGSYNNPKFKYKDSLFTPRKNLEFDYNDNNNSYLIPSEKDSQILLKSYSINTYINNTFHNNLDNSIVTNNNNVLFIDNNKSNHADRLDPKNAIKINKIKDNYINFLQKQNEDHNKLNFSLDSNNKKLLNKCSSLIKDNISLNKSLNEKSNRLNKIVQENINIKCQLDNLILTKNKNEQKIKYFEEQLDYYKTNNENYKKIIEELKEQIQILNSNMNQMRDKYDKDKKEIELNYKNNFEKIKKEKEKEINELKKNYEKNIQALNNEIKNLNFQNKELNKELESKDNVIKIMYKDNQKLITQNKLNLLKQEQDIKQIQDLNKILQTKETMLNSLKTKDTESDKLFLSKSNSCSYLKLEGSDFISENLTKLLNDNEENKVKIEYLSDKIKNMHQIEKKCDEIIEKNSYSNCTYKIRNLGNSKERKYDNQSYYESKNSKKTVLKKYGMQFNNNYINNNNESVKSNLDLSINLNNTINNISNSKMIYLSQNSSFKDYVFDTYKNEKKNNSKNNNLKIIEIGKIKKSPEVDVSKIIYKGKNFFKGEQPIKNNLDTKKEKFEKSLSNPYMKVFEEENEEIKKVKNYFYKRKSSDKVITINQINKKEENVLNNYYLYGIDRNNFLHIFDICNRCWINSKNIFEINLEKNAESFRKDYQYEGTLLFNTLYGVYVLTAEKTDTLYFYDSYKKNISKICKFNHGHNNGSIKYDGINKKIYVLGGKNTTACEYYSLEDKKVYKLPNLLNDRANASFVISEDKLFAFFGFCYSEDNYANNIEFLDLKKLDKWQELKNIKFLKENILFNMESVSTMYYKNDKSKILIYCGIQGEDEEFITDYYLIYDTKNNTMDKIDKWEVNQYNNIDQIWEKYDFNPNDPKGFHFAKNSNFILIENYKINGYNKEGKLNILIDYKNNVHFVFQDKEKIDIYRGEL